MSTRFGTEDWKAYAAQCDYSIARMAKGKEITRQYLRRWFIQHMGVNPRCWIAVQRLDEAMRLLPAGKSVKEVAAELGFRHCSDFTRFFHRKIGESPRQFQARFPRANK